MALDFYFGKEQADKYGKMVQDKLKGKVISKRQADDGEPGSLRYESEELNIDDFDMWTLLETLEGMCYQGMATEIDDSHYKVL